VYGTALEFHAALTIHEIMPDLVDHHQTKRFFAEEHRAPYLAVSSTEIQQQQRLDEAHQQSKKQNDEGKEEADAAAGGQSVMKRVSSFSVMNNNSSKSANLVKNHQSSPSRSSGRQQEDGSSWQSLNSTKPSWRLRDRMKTAGIGIVMSLNIGTGMLVARTYVHRSTFLLSYCTYLCLAGWNVISQFPLKDMSYRCILT
jgi:hypothetical protein